MTPETLDDCRDVLQRLVAAIKDCDMPYPDEERLAPLLAEAEELLA